MMYLKHFQTSLTRLCFRTGRGLRDEINKNEVLEGKFPNLNFSPSSILFWTFSFHLKILHIFLKFKTSELSNNCFTNKHKLLRKLLFQKRGWLCDFPPRKTLVAQKHRAISRRGKMAFSSPSRVVSGRPFLSSRVFTDGGSYGRTLTSETKLLARIGYQICLPMVLGSVVA